MSGEVGSAEEVRAAVRPLARRLDLVERLAPFAPHRWDGATDAPLLHLEDVSGIPFVSLVPGVEEYQHRARVRAGDGDLFVAVTPPASGFERYARERLGLGSPDFVLATAGEHPYAVAAACCEAPAFRAIVEHARRRGRLTIHPYMAIDEVWDLAARVADESGVEVQVLGSPPPALWVANDKAQFTAVVAAVLSEVWVVETHTARDPVEMVEHLLRLTERHAKVGLKRTRCASAMGNAVYDLERIRRQPKEAILDEVRAFLKRTEWALDEEVLIVAWEQTDDSPSTQLWIPPEQLGPPRVEGVYEQLLEGEERIFLGSRPSRLPAPVNAELTRASLVVGTALQALGYVGRCSFDFIIVGDPAGEFHVKFTECNGRWGGTSTPMRLVDRLFDGQRPPYRAQDWMHRDLIGVTFDEVLERVGDAAFDRRTGRGRFVFYNVGPLARHGKLDVIALGATPGEAERAIHEELPARLGVR